MHASAASDARNASPIQPGINPAKAKSPSALQPEAADDNAPGSMPVLAGSNHAQQPLAPLLATASVRLNAGSRKGGREEKQSPEKADQASRAGQAHVGGAEERPSTSALAAQTKISRELRISWADDGQEESRPPNTAAAEGLGSHHAQAAKMTFKDVAPNAAKAEDDSGRGSDVDETAQCQPPPHMPVKAVSNNPITTPASSMGRPETSIAAPVQPSQHGSRLQSQLPAADQDKQPPGMPIMPISAAQIHLAAVPAAAPGGTRTAAAAAVLPAAAAATAAGSQDEGGWGDPEPIQADEHPGAELPETAERSDQKAHPHLAHEMQRAQQAGMLEAKRPDPDESKQDMGPTARGVSDQASQIGGFPTDFSEAAGHGDSWDDAYSTSGPPPAAIGPKEKDGGQGPRAYPKRGNMETRLAAAGGGLREADSARGLDINLSSFPGSYLQAAAKPAGQASQPKGVQQWHAHVPAAAYPAACHEALPTQAPAAAPASMPGAVSGRHSGLSGQGPMLMLKMYPSRLSSSSNFLGLLKLRGHSRVVQPDPFSALCEARSPG